MGSIYTRHWKGNNGTRHESPVLSIKYLENGRVRRESTETTNRVVARRILRNREGDVEHGIPIVPKMGRITFDEAATDLIHDYTTNKKKSLAHVQRRIDLALKPAFKGKRLLSITTAEVRAYIAERQQAGAANATINRELAALKRMFSLAVQAGKLHAKPHIPMLREDNVRRGFFEAEAFASVRAQLPEPLQPLVTFAYLTGWRLTSEILPLEWRQVDWQGREVRLDPGTTKNREGRSFRFTNALETLLKDQLAEHERLKKAGRIVSLVFHRDGKRIRGFRRAWRSACEAAGVPGRLLHDFRRTAVRNLERAGVSRSTAMALVGHKTESIYRRYAIVDSVSRREAAVKIDESLGTVLGTVQPKQAPPTEQVA